jgi:hypothetical protein
MAQRMEEQAVLQMLSFGLEMEKCHIDCVNVTLSEPLYRVPLINTLIN